jgi:hypothetical protein
MMRLCLIAAATLVALAPPSPGGAGTPVTEKMTCPIGGVEFDFATTASYSTFGERPDGKPFGSWTFPMALPECPDNGLVLYKEYEAEEVARLEPLIASEAYQALRRSDTQYYRAYWLMKEMGLGPERHLWALLQASWEADGKPELKTRYLAELVEASAAVEPRPDDLNWIGMEGRSINALRELGRFDEAQARMDRLPLATIDAATDEKMRHWSGYFRELRTLIERRDASPEPLEMIPRNIALGRCAESFDTLAEPAKAFCEKEAAAVAALRAKKTTAEEELELLRKSREDSGR